LALLFHVDGKASWEQAFRGRTKAISAHLEDIVPLSEFERRELERISLDLEEDDPGLAVLLSQDPVPRFGRTLIGRGLTAILAGLCILVVGLLFKAPLVGVTGFAVMCAAGYWTTRNLRGIFAGGGSRGAGQLERNTE
jgi:hypothetical protein